MKASQIDLIELEIYLKSQLQTITAELEIVERLKNRLVKKGESNGNNKKKKS